MSTRAPKSDILRGLYWRSEILRVMYWLRGEGLGDVVDIPMLQGYLGEPPRLFRTHLARLVADGYVVRDGGAFALSDLGLREGAEFATAFSDLLRPRYGSCGPECWCGLSDQEADACSATTDSERESQRG